LRLDQAGGGWTILVTECGRLTASFVIQSLAFTENKTRVILFARMTSFRQLIILDQRKQRDNHSTAGTATPTQRSQ
jgi:hypothetical protein